VYILDADGTSTRQYQYLAYSVDKASDDNYVARQQRATNESALSHGSDVPLHGPLEMYGNGFRPQIRNSRINSGSYEQDALRQ
jgi:hypothetical protein